MPAAAANKKRKVASTGGVKKKVHVERNFALEAVAPQSVDVRKLKPGMLFSCREFGVIKKIVFGHIEVETGGGYVRIAPDLWKQPSYKVPVQTSHTEPCSRTSLVLTMQAWKELLWVKFRKKPKKGQTEGDVRELYGYMKGTPDTIFGHSKVVEVVVKDGKPVEQERLVNHETVMELKCDGVHYIVK